MKLIVLSALFLAVGANAFATDKVTDLKVFEGRISEDEAAFNAAMEVDSDRNSGFFRQLTTAYMGVDAANAAGAVSKFTVKKNLDLVNGRSITGRRESKAPVGRCEVSGESLIRGNNYSLHINHDYALAGIVEQLGQIRFSLISQWANPNLLTITCEQEVVSRTSTLSEMETALDGYFEIKK